MFKELIHKADLNNGYYLNPIFDGDYADPAVFRDGDVFYLTASTSRYRAGLTIFRSEDLVNWTPVCNALNNFKGDVWAPDILKFNDKYYIYFCANGSNWVICSNRIDSGWSEAIDLKVDHIDPGHCVDENGKRFLFLSNGTLVPLADDGLSVKGELKQVIKAIDIPDEWEVEGAFPEAPNVIKKNGYYYLIYADGGTAGPATAHMIISARSKNLYGPWEFSPYNPIVKTYSRDEKWHCKGHGHMVDDLEGNWWIIYHSYEKGYYTIGRKLLLEPLEYTSDGWFKRKDGVECDKAIKKPYGKNINIECSLSDDFTNTTGFKIWKSYDETDNSRYNYAVDGLELYGVGENPGESHPMTIIQGDHCYEITTQVKVSVGCNAGLILFYNPKIFNSISLSDGKLTIYRIGRKLVEKQVDCHSLFLKMKNIDHYLCFYYSTDGVAYKKLNYIINTESQNVTAYGGFLSLRPGIFSSEKGKAVFSFFDYKGLE